MRKGREQHVPDSSNHALYLLKLFNSSCPEGNFGGNRQQDGSMSLSPPIPKYNERFARQYRYEPPPEFPLILPFFGIVHNLSGLTLMLLLKPLSIKVTVSCRCTYPSIHFHCACRFNTRKLAHNVRLLGLCFKTGRTGPCGQKRTPRIEQQRRTVTSITRRLNVVHV